MTPVETKRRSRPAANKAALREAIAALPDATVVLEDAIAEGERVATRFTWRASQGPGLDIIATGGAIVRFADGQIAECWNLPADVHAVAA